MKLLTTLLATSCLLAAAAGQAADAKPTPFNGVDISGVYSCVGTDIHDGAFASVMTLTLDSKFSNGKSGAYKAKVEAEGALVYNGSIVTDGKNLAMDFANVDASKKDYGVALASVSHVGKGKFVIKKFYYEPEYMGAGNGVETCTTK